MNLKRPLSCLLALILIVGLFSGIPAPAQAADATRTVANVIVFVNFADTDHNHISYNWGHCFQDPAYTQETFDLFNGDAAHPTGMKQYLSTISYGQLDVDNIFPQYDAATNTITPYTLLHNVDYYAGADAIIQELLTDPGHSGKLSTALSGKTLDHDNNNTLDNLTVVVPCESGNSNSKFYSLQGTFSGGTGYALCGKNIGCYNLLTEASVYLSAGGSGTVIHEFLHTQGYPDLYAASSTARPVGNWCIMSSASRYTQYPLAYLRSQITGWFDIPTVTTSTERYTLHAPTSVTEATRNNQAVILKTDLSASEFFVLEYRKLGISQDDHEYGIHGSGLFIYRINTNGYDNRDNTTPYMVYVFRPGDTYATDGREACEGDLNSSFLSQESGRTTYGSADLDATLENGAITYADGRNSGIVIRNVGSAGGDTITFDISYTELPKDSYWSVLGSHSIPGNLTDSYLDADGTLYYLEKDGSNVSLCKYDGTNWITHSTAALPTGNAYELYLRKYGTDFYVGYLSAGTLGLAKWDGSSWTTLYTAPANEMDMTADDSGVYLIYSAPDNRTVYAYQYTASGGTLLGSSVAQCNSASNLSIAAENGNVALTYRDYTPPAAPVFVKYYAAGSNTWTDLPAATNSARGGCTVTLYQNQLYLLRSDPDGNLLYRRDLSSDSNFVQLGDAYATGSILEPDLCFVNGLPCVLYQNGTTHQLEATQLIDGTFVPMGLYLASEDSIASPRLHTQNGMLYAAYLSGDSYDSKLLNFKSYTPRTEHTHSYGSWTTISAATCTQAGSEKRTCTVCGGSETRTIAAKGHSWNSSATVDTPATYSHAGSQSIHCKNCDATKDRTTIPAKKNPFEDVTPGQHNYYYTPVLWALDEAVTTGKTETLFAPFDVCTRSQVVTFLWRAAGSPEPTTKTSPFTDVQDPNEFYYKAVLWAAENDITNGMEPTLFAPNRTVTRGQFVTFLWRLAGEPTHSGSNPFSDILPGPHSYYYDAVLWASGCGVTDGMGDGTFAYDSTCLRGQTVTFLYRYYTKVAP